MNKKYLLRKIGKRVCHVGLTISSVAVIASTTVNADEVVTSSDTDVTTVTEATTAEVTTEATTVAESTTATEATTDKVSKQETKEDSNAKKDKVLAENKALKAMLSPDSTATNNNGVYHQILKGKSLVDEASSETVQRKPMDLIAIVDFSSSLQVKRTEALTQLKTLIEKNLTDDDKIMLQGYIYNKEASYSAHGAQLDYSKLKEADWGIGFSTKLITKAEALSIIDKWLGIVPPNTPNGAGNYSEYFNAVAQAMGDLGFKTDDVDGATPIKTVPFEEVYTSQSGRNQTVSVIQFTDGWADTEKMDPTFADWAKKNAKTFMSVVNRNQVSEYDNNGEFSIKSMRELGHPNIYESTGKDKDVVMKEILEQFENTAVEKSTSKKKVTSKGVVNIKADKNVTLVSAKLVSPSGSKQELKIENNAVSTEVDLTEKGDYTVEYEFSANNNEAGTVTGSFVVNSKEELSGDKVEAGAKELPSTKDEKTDKFVPTPEEPTTEEVTTTVQKPKEEKQLPKTGTDSSVLLSAIGAISAVFGGLLYKKGKTE
jgi:LPXTG-motif cell wall-anchored protein